MTSEAWQGWDSTLRLSQGCPQQAVRPAPTRPLCMAAASFSARIYLGPHVSSVHRLSHPAPQLHGLAADQLGGGAGALRAGGGGAGRNEWGKQAWQLDELKAA